MKHQKQLNKQITKIYSKISTSCNTCDKGYCCINQKGIKLTHKEATLLKPLVNKDKLNKAILQHSITGVYTCPFLKDNKCSIYKIRPTICSSYYVNSPIEKCNTQIPQYTNVVIIDSLFKKLPLATIDMLEALK